MEDRQKIFGNPLHFQAADIGPLTAAMLMHRNASLRRPQVTGAVFFGRTYQVEPQPRALLRAPASVITSRQFRGGALISEKSEKCLSVGDLQLLFYACSHAKANGGKAQNHHHPCCRLRHSTRDQARTGVSEG